MSIKLSDFKNKHFLALTGNIVVAGISFGMTAVFTRIMTMAEVGSWFFFLMVYGLADSFRNGLLSTATIKFYAGSAQDRGRAVLGSVWFLALALSGALCLINVIGMFFIDFVADADIRLTIWWFGATLLSSLPYNVTFWILLAEEDYFKILWIRLINTTSMIILIILLAYYHKASLQNVLIVNFATNCLASLVCLIGGHSKFSSFVHRKMATISEIFHFGKYSLATNMSSYLLMNADTMIVWMMLGKAALAVYNIPFKLMELVEIPLRSFVGTGTSTMAIAYNNKDMDYLTFVSKKYSGMLSIVFVPAAVFVFFTADYAIALYAGKGYVGTEAANIFRLLMFLSILYPIDRFNGATLDILHQPKINFHKVLIMITINIIGAFVGVTLLKDLMGAALALPLATIAGLTYGHYHLRKHIPGFTIRGILVTGYIELIDLIKTPFK